MNAARHPLPLRSSLRPIAISGSLAIVYTTGINSPATTEYSRGLDADDWHFGWINGVPMVLLAPPFIGAFFVNRVRRRAPTFYGCLIGCQLVYLPIAFLPSDRLGFSTGAVMIGILALLALSAALHNCAVPFWFSWMADLVPRPILNRF